MLFRVTVISLSLLLFSMSALAESELTTFRQKQSYVLGIETAKLMSARGFQLLERDQEAFLRGLNDALTGEERLLSTTAYESMLAEVMQLVLATRCEPGQNSVGPRSASISHIGRKSCSACIGAWTLVPCVEWKRWPPSA